MEPTTQLQNRKRRRGRPVSDVSRGGEALKVRRERNREAQQIFRLRQKAASEAQERRIEKLEKVVEEMGSLCMTIVDQVTEQEAIARHCPAVMGTLRQSLAGVLTLVKDAFEADAATTTDDNNYAAAARQPPSTTTPAKRSSSAAQELGGGASNWAQHIGQAIYAPLDGQGLPALPFPPASSVQKPTFAGEYPTGLPFWLATGQETSTAPRRASARAPSSEEEEHSGSSVDALRTLPVPLLHPEVDWTVEGVDPVTIMSLGYRLSQSHATLDARSLLLSLGSFSLRLVETTLSTAYLILNGQSKLPPWEIQHKFGWTFRAFTRDQLATRIGWLLGPGRHSIHRASGLSWGRLRIAGGTGAPGGTSSSSPSRLDGVAVPPSFLTAVDVQEQLHKLGARMLDPDTMELFSADESSSSSSSSSSSPTHSGPQPGLRWYLESGIVPRQRTRVSVTLLTANLSSVAICFWGKGPVFPKSDFAKAVEASVVTVGVEEPKLVVQDLMGDPFDYF
ncbi:hypothetical protein VTK73DRAFT_811 [Phialemonium thermophilum]|uniref:BZIP domain-containing protein n=1 Tax=Phialemonium thermophilum TaxID=223376 RepID=A0ABR3XCH2_9PEZI